VIAISAALIAMAQDASVHPEIGTKPPHEMLNSDLLSLPERERQAWVHGAMAQLVTVLSATEPEQSACATSWYFGAGDGAELLPKAVDQYPDLAAAPTIWAVVQRACPKS